MDLQEAEKRLAALEASRHKREGAFIAFKQSEYTGDPKNIETARLFYEQALKAEQEAGVDDAAIHAAAEEVLKLRGEAHTETNILPSDHGAQSAEAEMQYNMARSMYGEGAERTKAARAVWDDAAKADKAARATHVEESHERTMTGAASE